MCIDDICAFTFHPDEEYRAHGESIYQNLFDGMVFVVIACCHLVGFITRVLFCSYYNNLIIVFVR
jgi:hypothetical protein